MPKLLVYGTGRKVTTEFTLAFARGAMKMPAWSVKHIPISEFNNNGWDETIGPGDAVASLGILRGTGMMYKEAVRRGVDYYYMDHAYFNPGYGGKGWMRITKNGHSCTTLRDVEPGRWKAVKGKNLVQPWRLNHERGPKIIICPPTHAVAWYQGIQYNWANKIKSDLEAMLPVEEHSRIVIREKPTEPIVDEVGNLVEIRKNIQEGSIEDDLRNAHCVIAYNSMVALQATIQGIPVIVGDISCCKRVGFDLSVFKSSPYPDAFNTEPQRAALLYWLACNQWRMREIEDGTAWRQIRWLYDNEY